MRILPSLLVSVALFAPPAVAQTWRCEAPASVAVHKVRETGKFKPKINPAYSVVIKKISIESPAATECARTFSDDQLRAYIEQAPKTPICLLEQPGGKEMFERIRKCTAYRDERGGEISRIRCGPGEFEAEIVFSPNGDFLYLKDNNLRFRHSNEDGYMSGFNVLAGSCSVAVAEH